MICPLITDMCVFHYTAHSDVYYDEGNAEPVSPPTNAVCTAGQDDIRAVPYYVAPITPLFIGMYYVHPHISHCTL